MIEEGLLARTNTVKDDKCDMVADSDSILDRWINHFSLLLDVPGVKGFKQT